MPGRAAAPTLDRMVALCELMGDPQFAAPVIHVTGTNGKGSTVKVIAELLQTMGLTVGTFTSPDLESVNERIARNGESISDRELIEQLTALAALEPLLTQRPNRFELLAAAAFRYFADTAVDVVVAEVGLGGRWDATNVVLPAVSVVTNVSEDHLEVLGPTLADVAMEKAGIIKSGSHLILGETDAGLAQIFIDVADGLDVPVWRRGASPGDGDFGCDENDVAVGGRLIDVRTPGANYQEVFLGLHGAHQGDNAACAVAAVEAFFSAPPDELIVRAALESVRVPGRLEVVGHSPLVVLDGAHNIAGARALARSISADFAVDGPVVVVMGLLTGRDPDAMLTAIASTGATEVIVCHAPSPRGLPVTELLAAAARVGIPARGADSVEAACGFAIDVATESGLVVVCGSLYVVGAARTALLTSRAPAPSSPAAFSLQVGEADLDGRASPR
ncbi:MAG: folylpolyglutamate synthase/dihydrofolate synthase family protein [Acidimicrobiales bacterium]